MKDDPEFNIRFVKCVEKQPCLYNYNVIEYSNRDEQERAWQDVAFEMKATVADCKNKWKNLRGSLTRYLLRSRAPQFGEKPVKPYYMYEALSFLLPFTKTRKPRTKFESYDYGHFADAGHQEEGSYQSMSECYEDEVIPWEEPGQAQGEHPDLIEEEEEPQSKRKRASDSPTRLEQSIISCLTQMQQQQASNPDLEFFKSILPDIASFSPRQKRIFKQGILRLIDEVEDDEEDRKMRKTARMAPPSSTSN
ncbi:uncharacterized protein [Halyomorpha halys]|uniref:uncharacterized protein n=1 Tax=Halyomorpha halys TaxID=286706 RepID=UPI0006D50001|nr:uncharacterized protein LOC106684144 isoform X1 [Halyomorpha halys]